MRQKPRVLVVCPTTGNKERISAFADSYIFTFLGIDANKKLNVFNVKRFLLRANQLHKKLRFDGAIGVHDYPASILASILATQWNLSGTSPQSTILAQNKLACRQHLSKKNSKLHPAFEPIYTTNPRLSKLSYPVITKPTKASVSQFAQVVHSERELHTLIKSARTKLPPLVRVFRELAKSHAPNLPDIADTFIAEAILPGKQVTVEGYTQYGKTHVFGVVDSIMFPGALSFSRFDYPSRLPTSAHSKLKTAATQTANTLGLNNTHWNIEMTYDSKTKRVGVIEVNPRMCTQFADLHEKVDGINTYERALLLATGKPPPRARKGKHLYASSFVLRRFTDAKVKSVPSKLDIAKARKDFPDAKIHIFTTSSKKLSDDLQDTESYRYGLVNVGGQSQRELQSNFEQIKKQLPFQFSN